MDVAEKYKGNYCMDFEDRQGKKDEIPKFIFYALGYAIGRVLSKGRTGIDSFIPPKVKLSEKEMCAILHSWETIEPKAALPLFFSEGSSSPPDERKEGDAKYVTYKGAEKDKDKFCKAAGIERQPGKNIKGWEIRLKTGVTAIDTWTAGESGVQCIVGNW